MELLTDCLIVNAWVLFNNYHRGSKELNYRYILKFQESIVLSLLTSSPEEVVKPGRRSVAIERATPHPSGSQHCLVEAEGPKRSSRKCCRGCYEKISLNEGSTKASKMTKKVSTY